MSERNWFEPSSVRCDRFNYTCMSVKYFDITVLKLINWLIVKTFENTFIFHRHRFYGVPKTTGEHGSPSLTCVSTCVTCPLTPLNGFGSNDATRFSTCWQCNTIRCHDATQYRRASYMSSEKKCDRRRATVWKLWKHLSRALTSTSPYTPMPALWAN